MNVLTQQLALKLQIECCRAPHKIVVQHMEYLAQITRKLSHVDNNALSC